jgi:hypothetical protein
MRHYAQNTEVSTERSRAEIERTLRRYGASAFVSGWNEQNAFLAFQLQERSIKFILPMPSASDKAFWYSHKGQRRRTDQAAFEAWEQACKARWRALGLCIKAKLEAIASGIESFEESFLAHFVLPNGQTLGEQIIPQLKQAKMPRLELPFEPKVVQLPDHKN